MNTKKDAGTGRKYAAELSIAKKMPCAMRSAKVRMQ
jgi:hypothetical protein